MTLEELEDFYEQKPTLGSQEELGLIYDLIIEPTLNAYKLDPTNFTGSDNDKEVKFKELCETLIQLAKQYHLDFKFPLTKSFRKP